MFKLSLVCGFSENAVRKFEITGHMSRPMFKDEPVDRLAAIRAVLETAGVEFLDGEEPGVKLRQAGP